MPVGVWCREVGQVALAESSKDAAIQARITDRSSLKRGSAYQYNGRKPQFYALLDNCGLLYALPFVHLRTLLFAKPTQCTSRTSVGYLFRQEMKSFPVHGWIEGKEAFIPFSAAASEPTAIEDLSRLLQSCVSAKQYCMHPDAGTR